MLIIMVERRLSGRSCTRRPTQRSSWVVLAFCGLHTMITVVGVEFWWPVDMASHRSAIAHRANRGHDAWAGRPVDYLLDYAAREVADYPKECSKRYHGLPFLQTINASWQQPVCAPQATSSLNSSLSCWFQFDKYAEAYCTGANLALDLAKFAKEEASIPRQTFNRNSEQLFVSFERMGVAGELLGDCHLDATVKGDDKWQADSFGRGGQKWLFNTFKSTRGESQQPRCVAWVDHPVYALNDKYDSLNLWHGLEDITHAFEAYALKGWGREVQVVVFDQVTPDSVLGPTYLAVWQKVLSPIHPPMLLRTLAEGATAEAKSSNGGQLPPGAALCFRDAFFSVHGGISLLSRSITAWTPCKNSTMVNAMVHFLLDGLHLGDVHPASHAILHPAAADQQQLRRQGPRGSSEDRGGGGGAAEGRMRVVWALRSTRAGYQAQVLEALQRHIPKETGAEVLAVEFGGLSIEEQIRRVREADVLVGYHGAALTLAIFMNTHSGLVEIEGSFRCTCYTNCALWRAHPYALIRTSDFAHSTARMVAEKAVAEVKAQLAEIAQRIRSDAAAR